MPRCFCCWLVLSDDCDDLLSALIKRARAYKAERERLLDVRKERERTAAAAAAAATGNSTAADAAATAAAAAAAAVQQAVEPNINWQSPPWR